MCVLCYELAGEGHWSDALTTGMAGEPPGRARHRRASILTELLAPAGLVVRTPGPGRAVVVSNGKGASAVAAGMPAVWEAADRLGTRRVDPLDTAYLDAVEARRSSSTGAG